jgi:O-antigen biosynthesis protein
MQIPYKKKRIVYLVPHVRISGGIHVVLQHVTRLKRRGYDAYLINLSGKGSIDWFPYADEVTVYAMEHKNRKEYQNIDVLIASSWESTEMLMSMKAKKRVYFVQSDDRRFTEDSDTIKAIHQTYKTKCTYMTEAIWIQDWLKDEFGHKSYYVPNGLDTDIVFEIPKSRDTQRKRVLLEGAIDTPFKGVEDAYKAVANLDVDIWIVSNGGKPPTHWKYKKFYENIPLEQMREIYSSCDILLKMSRVEGFFGPPLEAMACGTNVVVGKVTGYDEYITHKGNALVVEQSDIQAASLAVKRILQNKELGEKLRTEGYKTAKQWSWERSIDALERVWSLYHLPRRNRVPRSRQ